MKSLVHKTWYVERDTEESVLKYGHYAEVTRDIGKVNIKFMNNGLTLSFTKKAIPQLIEILKEIAAEDDVK